MEARLLTVDEVAEHLSVKPDTVRRWLRQGRLRGIRPGSRRLGYRVPISELERFAPIGPEPEVQQPPNPTPEDTDAAAIGTALATLREELLAADRQLLAEVVKSLPRTTSLSIQDRSQIVQALQAAEAHASTSRHQLTELQRQVTELTELVRQLYDTLPTSHEEPP